jgi:homoserine O-acetyltransferase/O-succinyltransferase
MMVRTSVGQVEERRFSFGTADDPMVLESGHTLSPVDVVYETYGTPNEDRSNAILICHALSGDAHVAGFHHPKDKRTGWWDEMVGPGKVIDTDRWWVICPNILGSCRGTTGPGSINPATGALYGPDFPVITIGDMVEVQHRLIEHLGIERLYAVIGGSLGGFQVLEWSVRFPGKVRSAVSIAAAPTLSAQGLAFNAVGRTAVLTDPGWQEGRYETEEGPRHGLAIARMIGHITYLSEVAMDARFGRKLQSADRYNYEFSTEFAVESYLKHQGRSFTERFDANSYLYITKAMDYFDLSRDHGGLDRAFTDATARFLVISYTSDWLFTTRDSREIVRALLRNKKDVSYIDIDSQYGHDAFLVESERLGRIMAPFLASVEDAT